MHARNHHGRSSLRQGPCAAGDKGPLTPRGPSPGEGSWVLARVGAIVLMVVLIVSLAVSGSSPSLLAAVIALAVLAIAVHAAMLRLTADGKED